MAKIQQNSSDLKLKTDLNKVIIIIIIALNYFANEMDLTLITINVIQEKCTSQIRSS